MTRRLIGDARETWLYDCRIEHWEAQQLADIEHRHNSLLNGVQPKVYFSGRYNERRCGCCWPNGDIVLSRKGENFGTLAHELAHLNARHEHGHGQAFKEAQLSILDSFEEYAEGRR